MSHTKGFEKSKGNEAIGGQKDNASVDRRK